MAKLNWLLLGAFLLECATATSLSAATLFRGNSYTFAGNSFSSTTETQPLNAVRAQRAFFAASPGARTITFDSLTVGQTFGATASALNSDVSLAVTGTGTAAGRSTIVRNTTSAAASQQTQAGFNVTGGINGGPQAVSGTTLGTNAYSDVSGSTRNYLFSNLVTGSGSYTQTLTFTFSRPVSSFGFFVTGLGNLSTVFNSTFNGFAGAAQQFSYVLSRSGTTRGGYEFIGVTNALPLTRVELTFGAASIDNIWIDDISYSVVPEPEFGWALLALAVPVGLAWGVRNRRLADRA